MVLSPPALGSIPTAAQNWATVLSKAVLAFCRLQRNTKQKFLRLLRTSGPLNLLAIKVAAREGSSKFLNSRLDPEVMVLEDALIPVALILLHPLPRRNLIDKILDVLEGQVEVGLRGH